MFAVPFDTPVKRPVAEPIVATPVALLVHTPPAVALVSVALAPKHNTIVPVIAAGLGLIVTALVTKQDPIV